MSLPLSLSSSFPLPLCLPPNWLVAVHVGLFNFYMCTAPDDRCHFHEALRSFCVDVLLPPDSLAPCLDVSLSSQFDSGPVHGASDGGGLWQQAATDRQQHDLGLS